MTWLDELNQIREVRIHFPSEGPQGGLPVVVLLQPTGELLTLNELSLSSLPLPQKTAYVALVILATVVLTRLQSSWMETSLRTIADQPRICQLFLTTSSMISATWDDMWAAVYNKLLLGPRRGSRR